MSGPNPWPYYQSSCSRANDPGKDNIVMIIEKNTVPEEDKFYEYCYYIARIQRRFIRTKNDGLGHNIHIID